MEDHPMLGAVLFVIGAILVGWVYLSANVPPCQLLGSWLTFRTAKRSHTSLWDTSSS